MLCYVMQTNLEKGAYKSLAEAAADIRLVWMNCMTYNQVTRMK